MITNNPGQILTMGTLRRRASITSIVRVPNSPLARKAFGNNINANNTAPGDPVAFITMKKKFKAENFD